MSEAKSQAKAAGSAELKIQVSPEIASGTYANLAMINHSPDEFIADFIFVQPGTQQGDVRARVILTPGHFKRLVAAMQQNLERYEKAFGAIPERSPAMPVPQGPVN